MVTFHLKLGKGVQRQDTLWPAKRGQTMSATRKGVLAVAAVCGLMTCARVAGGASATWLGTTDGTWATESNWSAAPVPGAGDTATFSGAGNGNTAIDIGAGVALSTLGFASGAASYVFSGSGGLTATAAITMAAENDQTLNVPVTAPYISEYNLANNGAGKLVFNETYGFTSNRRANFSGTGDIYLNGGTVNTEWCRKLGPNTLFVSNNVQFQYEMTFCEGTVNYNATNQNSTTYAYFIIGDQANKRVVFNMNGGRLERQLESGTGWAGRYNPMSVGHASSSTGVVTQAGGFMNILGSAYLGYGSGAVGEYRMSGGSAYFRNDVVVGHGASSIGLVDISGGNFWDQYWVKIGNNASALATWIQSGGVVTGGHFRVGSVANSRAALHLSGGSMTVYHLNCSNYGRLYVAADSGAKGGLIMTNGDLTATMHAIFGAGVGSCGGLLQSGGLLDLRGEVNLGGAGVANALGVWDISGGEVAMKDWFLLGRGTGNNSGVVTVRDAGRVTIADAALNRMVFAFSGSGPTTSTNVLTVADGGQFLGPASSTYYLNLAEMNNTGILGALNLNSGGLFRISRIEASANPTAVVNFNGGTLQASIDSASFLTDADIDTITVYNAGGTIDNNSKAITVSRPILAASETGVADVDVTDGGSGYVSAPAVYFTGGAGTPATAYAVMEPDSAGSKTFKVKEIRVSSPGRYTSVPTSVSLVGGGAIAEAALGAITTAANTSGGMTFSGAGTTILAGANTYTGATVVVGGTLQIDGSLVAESAVAVASDARLTGAGSVSGAVAVASGGILANASAANKLTLGSLTFGGAATLDLKTDEATEGLRVNGALATTPANGKVTVNVVAGPVWQNGGTYRLIQYGSYGGDVDAFELGSVAGLGARQSAELGVDSVNGFITLTVSGETLRWTGETNAKWALDAELLNWRLAEAGTVTAFMANDLVLFDDQATGSTTVDISDADVSPAAVLFSNSGKNYTVSSGGGYGIASGTLVKNGSGMLSINTANTYGGGTAVNGGSVTLGTGSALGIGAVALNAGTLDINGQSVGNAIGLNGGFLVGNGTLGGSLSGTGGIAKTTSGTLTLAAGGSYSGGTLLSAGTLAVTANYALGAGPLTLAGGTLQFTGDVALTNDLVAQAATTVAVAISGGSVDLFGNLSGSGTINANVGGSVYCGARLGGNNSGYSGTITMGGNSYARHKFYSPNAGSSNAFWTINGADSGSFVGFPNPSTIYLGALGGNANMRGGFAGLTVEIGALNQDSTFSGNFQSAALTLRKIGAGTLTLSGSVAYTGPTEVNGGVLSVTGTIPGGGTMNVNTNAKLAGTGTVGSAVIVNAGGRVAPGTTGIGTLTVGSLTLAQGGGLAFDLGAADASDKVVTSGALTLDGLSFADCVFTAAAGFGNGTYVLVDAASVTGSLGTVASGRLPSGKRGKFVVDAENGNLLLEVTNMGTMVRLQ